MDGHPSTLRMPRLSGCFIGLLWLAVLILTVLLFAAGYGAIRHGQVNEEAALAQLGWWLIAGGIASTVILCCLIIIPMRLRNLSNTDTGSAETDQPVADGNKGDA